MDILQEIQVVKKSVTEREFSEASADRCIVGASRQYGVHPLVIKSVMKTEGGKIGSIMRNTNGTYDLGPMQINTINLEYLRNEFPGLTWRHLAFDLCTNVFAGAYFLQQRIQDADNYWEGVGNYHSKTKKFRERYLGRLIPIYEKLVAKYKRRAQYIASQNRQRSRTIHIR